MIFSILKNIGKGMAILFALGSILMVVLISCP